jgi:UPF0755 protein
MTRKTKILILALSGIFLIAILALYIKLLTLAPEKNNQIKKTFEIKPNTPSVLIAEDLKKEDLIKSKWLFLLSLKLKKGVIFAGTYELSPSFSLLKVVRILISGQVKEWVVTFPEGYSLKDMAERLAQKGIVKKEDFLSEASLVSKYEKDFPFLSEIKTSNLEGYLFPDTYRFPIGVKSEEIIKEMLSNFNKKLMDKKITPETLILASIVEREAKKPEDRPLIASVFLNRLAQKMKLEADPTVQYAKGSWDKITVEDYKIDSPYNTYKYPGLPPGPICNPGLESIKAVLYPEKTDYLYFFHTKDGRTFYSKTKEEHEQKKKEYLH